MQRRRVLGAALLAAALTLPAPAWALSARISGIEGEAADNIENYLAALDGEQYSPARLESEVRRRAAEALRPFGYYEPEFELSLVGEPVTRVEIAVTPGPQVVVRRLAISVRGAAGQDAAFEEVLASHGLAEGEPLRHAPYDRLRNRLAGLALERGYFDSYFRDRRLEVRPWEQSAHITLNFDSGPRYRFGEVDIQGSHIRLDRLERMLNFAPGDPYLAGDLSEYTQRLGQSGWFGSVSVRPRLPGEEGGARPDGPEEVPVSVQLTPADRHQFEVALGYATDVGPRTRFAWNQPWINSRGHSLNHDLFISQPEQRFSGEYRLPLADPLRDNYRLQYGLRHRDQDDTRSLESSVEIARQWRFDNHWVQSLYLRSSFEDFTQGGEAERVWLLYPGISWSRTRTRNPRFPTWGDRQRLAFEYSDTSWGSSASFFRTTLDSQWIRMWGDNTRLIGRTGAGLIETNDFDKIPPSLRFFTGGDRSVRGYGYESLAPRNEEGRLRGGRQLFTASAEVQRRVTGNWWAAAFVDTGDAFDDWWPDQLKTGAGLGVRWVSPVGPIRLDIAHPFDDEENAWRLHFAIGPEF
ncbi:outer membrane protein assembly factor [Halomonas sp. 328]|nr:autotransporter assembly complex family protein [Halomonas sp. 328]MBF8221641.1 outer membrane protein assembly factor [Halomonas sp. 328]